LVTSVRQEASPVAINLNERPWAMSAVCAPKSAARVILGADLLPVSRVHQAQVQAELILAPASLETYGPTGFTRREGAQGSKKRMDVSGVPPRGRPV